MPVSLGGSNLNWPQMTVEACFNQDPFDPSPPAAVWTAIAGYVTWNSKSGRQFELARTDTGELALTVDNQDGRFDPSNTSSPYWPNVLPYRQIRIKATWAATTYGVWYGYVERWPQYWANHKGWSDLVCVDVFGPLALKTFRSCYDEEILADSPLGYYPLSEPSAAVQFGNIAATPQPPAVIVNSKYGGGTVTPGTPSIVPSDTATCVQMGGAADTGGGQNNKGSVLQLGTAAMGGPFITATGSTGLTFECWFQLAAPDATADLFIVGQESTVLGTGDYRIVVLHSTGRLQFFSGNANATSSAGYADNKPHHLVFTVDTSGNAKGYVDNVQVVSYASGGYTDSTPGWLQLAGLINSFGTQNIGNFTLAHVAIYAKALNSTQVGNHFTAGKTAFAGELSGARFSRLLRYAAYIGPSSVDTGLSPMAPADLAGLKGPDGLQQVADAENGVMFASGDSAVGIVFKSRSARYDTAVAATLGELETPYLGDVRYDFDPTFVYGRIEVTRPGGVTVAVQDATSLRRYGDRVLQETPRINVDAESTDRANYKLTLHKAPHMRLPQATIDPASNPALWPVALGTKIGDHLQVKRRPFGAPQVGPLDVFVEHVEHDVTFRADGPPRWRVTYLLSPADTSSFWKLDDAVFGKLDSGNLVAY